MRYLPHTPEDIAAMLDVVGVDDLDDLFGAVPKGCLRDTALDLPEPLTEWEPAGMTISFLKPFITCWAARNFPQPIPPISRK